MDIPRGFKAPFEDRTWPTKLGIGLVVAVLGITSPALIGYEMAYTRSVALGDERLPDWRDFLRYWVRGVAVIVAAIPYIVVGLLLFGIGVIPAVILLAAAIVEYAMTDRWSSMFSLRDLWRRIRGNDTFWQALLVTWGISVLASAVAGPANSQVRYLITAAVNTFLAVVGGHLYGQWANDAYVSSATNASYPSHMPGGNGYPPPPPPTPGPGPGPGAAPPPRPTV